MMDCDLEVEAKQTLSSLVAIGHVFITATESTVEHWGCGCQPGNYIIQVNS